LSPFRLALMAQHVSGVARLTELLIALFILWIEWPERNELDQRGVLWNRVLNSLDRHRLRLRAKLEAARADRRFQPLHLRFEAPRLSQHLGRIGFVRPSKRKRRKLLACCGQLIEQRLILRIES